MTKKGKGYAPAESNPGNFHGVSTFDLVNSIPDPEVAPKESFSTVFGNVLNKEGAENQKICAITAAMKYGTGLQFFAHTHPKRFFDVGMAEQHAVTFAAGLASQGMLPVVCIYSTFLQRSYDQIIHDVNLLKENVVLAIDRAGFVPADGETHQGIFDPAFLSQVGIPVYSPSNYAELAALACPSCSVMRCRARGQSGIPAVVRAQHWRSLAVPAENMTGSIPPRRHRDHPADEGHQPGVDAGEHQRRYHPLVGGHGPHHRAAGAPGAVELRRRQRDRAGRAVPRVHRQLPGYLIWDPVHMYNATTNGWTNFEHQITFDVSQPKTHKYSMERLRKFIAEHPYVNVIRYTTFFHQFTLSSMS